MFQSNNPAIDTNILAERARAELARTRLASSKHSGFIANIGAPLSAAIPPSKFSRFARNRLRHIPILGNLLSWASWILRVKQIATMVFNYEARLSKMQREIDYLDQTFHVITTSLETKSAASIVASRDNARAIHALRAEIEMLRAQNALRRQETKSRSRSADAS